MWATLALAAALAAQDKPEALLPDLAGFHRPVTTAVELAQRYFDQGLMYLYSFHYPESRRSFEAAIKADPDCGMAYWGLAATYGPTINSEQVPVASTEAAQKALEIAAGKRLTDVEKGLVAASKARFRESDPKRRQILNADYRAAMGKLWKENPSDPDVGSLYAEALLDERPWNQWTPAGQPNPGTLDAIAALDQVLKLASRHPMGLHLYIHAIEASPTPGKALDAADKLFGLLPTVGHMQHMPCHIYARIGDWKKAVEANLSAIAMVDAYRVSRGLGPSKNPNVGHYGSALAFAAGMRGQSAIALKALTTEGIPMETLRKDYRSWDGDLAMPLEVMQQFGKWDAILAAPSFGEELPISETMRFGARTVAFAAKGDLDSARREQSNFLAWLPKVSPDVKGVTAHIRNVLEVERHLIAGEILVREPGKEKEAIEELRRAVDAEDALPYSEPPDWIMPSRHALGAALLKIGKYKDAEDVFTKNLQINPNDGWATLGLHKAYLGQEKTEPAAKALAQFRELWKDADVKISTSCMCLEPPG